MNAARNHIAWRAPHSAENDIAFSGAVRVIRGYK